FESFDGPDPRAIKVVSGIFLRAVAHWNRNLTGAHLTPLRKQSRALNNVEEFPYIAGPLVRLELAQRGRGENLQRRVRRRNMRGQKMTGKQSDVTVAVNQTGQIDPQRIQPEVKIGAKRLFVDTLLDVPVCRGDDSTLGFEEVLAAKRS